MINTIIYMLNKNISKTEDGEKYVSYGIEAWVIKNVKYQLALYVPDLFLEYDRARKFVNLCNLLQISLVHILDIIEDELP